MVPQVAMRPFKLTEAYTAPRGAFIIPDIVSACHQGFTNAKEFDPDRFRWGWGGMTHRCAEPGGPAPRESAGAVAQRTPARPPLPRPPATLGLSPLQTRPDQHPPPSPERKEDVTYASNFLVFGHGPHYCVGKEYAINHLMAFLAIVSTAADWQR
jgi:cytochrome P450